MEIRKRFHDDIAVLYITGNLDINSAALIEVTGQLLQDGIKKILCNFTNVDAVDYNGLSIIAIAYKNVTNQKGILKFCDVPPHIKELFRSARLDTTFELYADEEEALEKFELTSKVDKLPLRRRFKRIDLSIPVKYKVGISSNNKLLKGRILNISGEGLFIYSKDTFPVSTRLYMEMKLPGIKNALTLAGMVIWLADKELQLHSYPGMGINIIDLDEETQKAIIDFIDKNITQRSKI